jgi:uncharacterized protein YggE
VSTLGVRGHGVARGVPDEAVVTLEVAVVRPRPEDAYDDVARRSADLERLLDDLGVDAGARATGGIAVTEEYEYVEGRQQHRGYAARNTSLVRLRDPAVVAQVLRDAVAVVQAKVYGPSWHLDPDNEAHAEACRAAAEDSRRRAEAFAKGLGLRLGAVLGANEPGVRVPEPAGRVRAFMVAEDAGPPSIPVDPGEHDVHATLEVTYALEPA